AVFRVSQRTCCCREVPAKERLSRDLLLARKYLPSSYSFISEEEESSIVVDWATSCCAELISTKWRFRSRLFLVKKVPGVQFVISEKLPHRRMKLVGSGLRAHDD